MTWQNEVSRFWTLKKCPDRMLVISGRKTVGNLRWKGVQSGRGEDQATSSSEEEPEGDTRTLPNILASAESNQLILIENLFKDLMLRGRKF